MTRMIGDVDLPSGWRLQRLDEICRIRSGGTPPKIDPTLWAGTFPWASGKDLKRPRLTDSIDHITEEAAQEFSEIAPAGSVLALVRGMGLVNSFAVSLIERPMAFNQDLKALIPLEHVAGPFLVHALTFASRQVLQNVTDAAHGTKRLSQDDLRSFELVVPPLTEQHAMAAVLDALVAAIDVERFAFKKAEQLKVAAMRELFKRGLRGEAQQETDFGSVPASWRLTTIGTLSSALPYGLSIRGKSSGTYPILRMNCQEAGKVVFRDLQYVDLEPSVFAKFRLHRGDILFNRTNSIDLVGRCALFESDNDAVFASYLIRLRLAEGTDSQFVNEFLNWEVTQAELKKLASRAVGQANISAGKLRTFVIPLPSLSEQREIAGILRAIDEKIEFHKKKRTVLEGLFKSLLHKLMTGEIRVSDLDLSVFEQTTARVPA